MGTKSPQMHGNEIFSWYEFIYYFYSLALRLWLADPLPDKRIKRACHEEKPIDFSYHKWAHLRVPMLISAGDDTKLFVYSVKEFTKFSPHDICPAPQRTPIQLVLNNAFNQSSMLLVQSSHWLDILSIRLRNGAFSVVTRRTTGGLAKTDLLA